MTRFINALNAKRASLGKDEKGFTLIELLVVVIIIGILAAIAIPIYIGIQNNAKDSAVQSDLGNIKTSIIAYYTDTSTAAMPTLDVSTLGKYGFVVGAASGYAASGTPAAASGSTSSKFCIQATSVTTNVFSVTSSGAITKAACPASTAW